MIINGFALDPDPYLLPSYRISPFCTGDVRVNRELKPDTSIDQYFSERFRGQTYIYTDSGRSAISIALRNLLLQPKDVVTIMTTSGNSYISGCVTKEIEKVCKWSMRVEENTRVVFINHEFGFTYQQLGEIKNLGYPVIEDFAHSFLSNNSKHSAGTIGDYLIYSFPKYFPIQIGGLLVSKNREFLYKPIDINEKQYIQKVLSHYAGSISQFALQRRENYRYLSQRFSDLGMFPRFALDDLNIPGVFLFTVENSGIDLPGLKVFLTNHGIQCSVFYGERAFYIPVHHRLVKTDMDYFVEAVRYYCSGRRENQ